MDDNYKQIKTNFTPISWNKPKTGDIVYITNPTDKNFMAFGPHYFDCAKPKTLRNSTTSFFCKDETQLLVLNNV